VFKRGQSRGGQGDTLLREASTGKGVTKQSHGLGVTAMHRASGRLSGDRRDRVGMVGLIILATKGNIGGVGSGKSLFAAQPADRVPGETGRTPAR
jgi:hypothetical protein